MSRYPLELTFGRMQATPTVKIGLAHVVGLMEPGVREHAVKLKVLIYRAEEGGYWAKVPAIPGCVSQGETLEEVKANILDALEGCLSVREEMALLEDDAVEEMEV